MANHNFNCFKIIYQALIVLILSNNLIAENCKTRASSNIRMQIPSNGMTVLACNRPIVLKPADINICSGLNIPLQTFISSPPNATFTWTNTHPAIGLAGSGSGNIPAFLAVNSTNTVITATISVTPTLAGCTGRAVTYNITVNPIPVVTNITNINACTSQSVPINSLTSSPTGATFTWTNSNETIGLAGSGTGNIPAFLAANTLTTATISVIPTLVGCKGTAVDYNITTNPTPVVADIPNIIFCSGQPVPINSLASTPTGATFTWTNTHPSIGLVGSGTGNIPTFLATNSTNTVITATISVSPTLGGCIGTAVDYNIIVNPKVTPTFAQLGPYCVGATTATLPPTSTNGVDGSWNAAISTAAAGTTTFTFTPTTGCNTTATMDVVVNENMTPTFAQVGPYCVGTNTATLPSTSTNGVDGSWNAAISTAAAGTITYTFTPTTGCNTTATMDVVVNENVTTTFAQVGPYCIGATTATLPPTSTNGVDGSWNAAISTAAAGTITYTFTPTTGCNTTATMDVVVNENMTPTFAQVGPYCAGTPPATLPSTSTNGVDGSWNAAISTAAAGTTTFTFTPTTGCNTTATMDVVVNENMTPTFAQVGPYCAGTPPATLPSTSTNSVAGSWNAAISTAAAGTITYTFTSTTGCNTTATMDVVVIENVTTTFAQVGPYCIGATPATLPSTSTNGVDGSWNAAISTAAAGTTTFTFTPTAGCNTTATMDVVVNEIMTPTFPQLGPYCVGYTHATLPSTSTNGVAGTWNTTISTATASVGTTTYTFTPTDDCNTTATMDVVVNEIVTPTFAQVDPYCVGASPAILPTTSTNGVVGSWNAVISTATAGTITYTFTPTAGCYTTATMDIVVEYCIGINSESDLNQFSIFPNPSHNFINLIGLEKVIHISLLNIKGKVVYTTSEIRTNKLRIDLKNMSNGMYFLKIKTSKKLESYKIIKH
jgi:hypothetical protein